MKDAFLQIGCSFGFTVAMLAIYMPYIGGIAQTKALLRDIKNAFNRNLNLGKGE